MIPDVAVRCAEEVVLPCKALQDSSISHQTASWYKVRKKSKLLERSALLSCLILACLVWNGLFSAEESSHYCSREKAALQTFELTKGSRLFGDRIFEHDSLNCSWPAFLSNYCWLLWIKIQMMPHVQPAKCYSKEESSGIFFKAKKWYLSLGTSMVLLLFNPLKTGDDFFLWNRRTEKVLAML